MNVLMLRGQRPCDRDVNQVLFSSLDENDDMWTHLAHEIAVQTGGCAEVWYEKGERVTRYNGRLTERWVPRYCGTKCIFKPDIVFSRGGFTFQLEEARRHPSAFKVYYGAGERAVPKAGQPWDLVLVDTQEQFAVAKARRYGVALFIKPAAENVFKPVGGDPKYDVIMVANHNLNTNKGHRFVLPATAGLRVLHVGLDGGRKWAANWPHVKFMGWRPRKEHADLYAQARVAVIWATGKDSCPRVVPEALACNKPVIVARTVTLNQGLYVTDATGCLAEKATFRETLEQLLEKSRNMRPRSYYDTFLSLSCSASSIVERVRR